MNARGSGPLHLIRFLEGTFRFTFTEKVPRATLHETSF